MITTTMRELGSPFKWCSHRNVGVVKAKLRPHNCFGHHVKYPGQKGPDSKLKLWEHATTHSIMPPPSVMPQPLCTLAAAAGICVLIFGTFASWKAP